MPWRVDRESWTADQYRGLVVLMLAAGVAIMLGSIGLAVLLVELQNLSAGTPEAPVISENATQIITGLIGGIIGVIAGFVGSSGQKGAKGPPGNTPNWNPKGEEDLNP